MTASYSILQAGKGTRTLDLLITNQLRYRLRYSSISLQQKLLYLLMDNFASKKMKYSHNFPAVKFILNKDSPAVRLGRGREISDKVCVKVFSE